MHDELGEISALAFAPNAIRDEPKIYPGHVASRTLTLAADSAPVQIHKHKNAEDEHGDLLIRGLCTKCTDCIIGV